MGNKEKKQTASTLPQSAHLSIYSTTYMCGIFSYLGGSSRAGSIVLNGLKSLEYRGYDSWGVALKRENGDLFIEKHTGKIGEAKLPKLASHIGIGHTRWATHGGVTKQNAHPHIDCQGEIVVVHNGIVENFEKLKHKLLSREHKFKSETDTEVIAHFIEEKQKHKESLKQAVVETFFALKGMNAIIVFHPKTEEFLAIKNGSPLVFGYQEQTKEYCLASDSFALLPHTNKVYFLEDEELLQITPKGFALFDSRGKEKKLNFLNLNYPKQQLNLGKYKHYMIKEISEQPKVLQNIVDNERGNITSLANKIKRAYGSYFIGCGTAYYACLAGSYLFSKIASHHVNPSIGSEFNYCLDFLQKTSLVLALSQSGETIDIVASIKKAKDKGAQTAALTNVLGSTLYRMVDHKMLLNAGPEKCVLATKSFTAKIAVLYLAAHALNNDYESGRRKLNIAIDEVKKLINRSFIFKQIATKLKNKEHIYILGRGVSYPTALESALKIKEVSYIHAEGFAGGELKHGVIALIDKGSPVIVFNPTDETYEDTLSSAYEVKARGAQVIGVSSHNNSVFDKFIQVADCAEATIIPNVVVAQLLGYYLALAKGYDPDKPRNLAKSVTVK